MHLQSRLFFPLALHRQAGMEWTLNHAPPADRGQWEGCTPSACHSPEHADEALVSGTTTSSQSTRLAEQSLQLWKGHVSLASHQGQEGAVSTCPLQREDAKLMSSTGISGWSRCVGQLKDCCRQPGPAQAGREVGYGNGCAITEGQSCLFCPARPHSPSLPQGSRSVEVTVALPRSEWHGALPRAGGCACSPRGEAGWRAPKSYLQLGARTRVIPASQGVWRAPQHQNLPGFADADPGASPSRCSCAILGTGSPAARAAPSPAALRAGRSPRAQRQRCSALLPEHSGGRRGAAEDTSHGKACRHRSVQPYGRLVVSYLALSSNNNSRVSSICKTFGLSQHARDRPAIIIRGLPINMVAKRSATPARQSHGLHQAQINIL